MPKYEVSFIYKGQKNYVVIAEDHKEAIIKARDKFDNGDPGTILGNEWQIVESENVFGVYELTEDDVELEFWCGTCNYIWKSRSIVSVCPMCGSLEIEGLDDK